jgi:LacI family transcriptional regulator
VVGFNDVFGTRYMTPPLTTVGFDAAKIGELGAQLVLKDAEAAAEDKQPTIHTIKPQLIVRGSTGFAKQVEGGVRASHPNLANGHAPLDDLP